MIRCNSGTDSKVWMEEEMQCFEMLPEEDPLGSIFFFGGIPMNHEKTKRLTVTAMLCALAFVAVAALRVPITSVEFLKYEPKDVVIAIGGFLYGPLTAVIISTIVSLIEMLTISTTGWIGLLMNVLSSCAFAGVAALVYRRDRTLRGAMLGLGAGVVCMTAVMVLWNYLITPLYMGTPRATVATMLLPVFLPFNLLKGCLNAALTALLYRPVTQGLRRARLLPASDAAPVQRGSQVLVWAGAAALLTACIVLILTKAL